MNGKQIKDFRKRKHWTQQQLADVISNALGRSCSQGQLGRWENSQRETPPDVDRFLDQLALNGDTGSSGPGPADSPGLGGTLPPEDTAPDGSGDGFRAATGPSPQAPLTGDRTAYTKACEELTDILATIVSTSGMLLNNEKLMVDGQIIGADKKAWGQAFGHLAETNDSFRRILLSASQGGAWVEVALVTGQTAGKILQNHLPVETTPPAEAPVFGGADGSAVPAPAAA